MILENWIQHRGQARPPRAGAVHSDAPAGSEGAVITPDSDFGSGPDSDTRVFRIDGKHWMLPAIAGKMLDAATWQLEIAYNGDGAEDLGTSWEETWQAGTFSRVLIGEERTVITENDPGWQSISDALAGRRHLMPEPDDDTYWSLNGFGGIYWTLEGFVGEEGEESPARIEVQCLLGTILPAFHASAPPISSGRWNPADLEPVWWVSMTFTGRVYISDTLVSQVNLGTFEGHEIGTVGGGDSEWTLALSILHSHDTV